MNPEPDYTPAVIAELHYDMVRLLDQHNTLVRAVVELAQGSLGAETLSALHAAVKTTERALRSECGNNVAVEIDCDAGDICSRLRDAVDAEMKSRFIGALSTASVRGRVRELVVGLLGELYPTLGNEDLDDGFWDVTDHIVDSRTVRIRVVPSALRHSIDVRGEPGKYIARCGEIYVVGPTQSDALIALGLALYRVSAWRKNE